jgi:hypothetical protein
MLWILPGTSPGAGVASGLSPNLISASSRRLRLLAVALLCATVSRTGLAQDAALPAEDVSSCGSCIMARMLARRSATVGAVRDARYVTWARYTARDLDRRVDRSRDVALVDETRGSAWWQRPDDYSETVEARRRAGRGGLPGLPGVAELANVLVERVELGEAGSGGGSAGGRSRGSGRLRTRGARYSLPLPFAKDAASYYDFRPLDTVRLDGRLAYRVAVVPRPGTTPLFTGTLDIADSTFDLLAADLGVNDGVSFQGVDSLRYRIEFADAGAGRWLPRTIRFGGVLRPRVDAPAVPREVAGIRVPIVPSHLAFVQTAALDSFELDGGREPADAREYRLVIREGAERPDSAVWLQPPALPPTDAEQAAFAHADSSEQHPGTIARLGRGAGAVMRLASDPGFFHYSRVDGVYLGARTDWLVNDGLIVTTGAGYAFGRETWQYRAGVRARLWEAGRLWVGASARDETVTRPTLISGAYNPTFRALFTRADPLDYFRERGLTLSIGARIIGRTRLDVRYDDAVQSSLDTLPGPGLASQRANPAILDGHLRSVTTTLSFDSRRLQRRAGTDFLLPGPSWIRFTAEAEVAAPSLIPNDFAYRRYALQLVRQQASFLGSTTVALAGGFATGDLPPQRYFMVDFGMGVLAADGIGFSTLQRTNYSGNRAAVIAVRHDFDRRLFAASGIPLLRRLPAVLSVNAGVFWTTFVGGQLFAADSMLQAAPAPYREVGFSLGNLTPFLAPFNLAAQFSWQLSSYPTRRFRFGVGFSGF